MVNHELLRDEGILIIRPEGSLEASDFQAIAQEIDPYIEAHGKLHGLLIDAAAFPGWKDFAALLAHFKFVKGHHQKIEKIAAVSDSNFLVVVRTGGEDSLHNHGFAQHVGYEILIFVLEHLINRSYGELF